MGSKHCPLSKVRLSKSESSWHLCTFSVVNLRPHLLAYYMQYLYLGIHLKIEWLLSQLDNPLLLWILKRSLLCWPKSHAKHVVCYRVCWNNIPILLHVLFLQECNTCVIYRTQTTRGTLTLFTLCPETYARVNNTGVCYSVCSITHERVVLISLLSACCFDLTAKSTLRTTCTCIRQHVYTHVTFGDIWLPCCV